jgi:hypothetical protein
VLDGKGVVVRAEAGMVVLDACVTLATVEPRGQSIQAPATTKARPRAASNINGSVFDDRAGASGCPVPAPDGVLARDAADGASTACPQAGQNVALSG